MSKVPALGAVCLTLGLGSIAYAQQAPAPAPGKPASSAHAHGDAGHLTEGRFITMMTKHHQDGIEMATREESGGASAEVKAIAARIRQSQERELSAMKRHSSHAASASEMSGHAEHQRMEQQSQASMKRLESASGAALDRAFLEEMAKHHQMAIDMIGRTTFKNAEMRQMAQKMAAGQKQELGELKQLQKKTS